MGAKVRCFLVNRDKDGNVSREITQVDSDDLPPGDVDITVNYSSLNFKDALAASAHPGVARSLPHVPGIDAAGTVLTSTDPRFAPGKKVVVTGYELGAERWGGWSERIRVPADWVVALPDGLTLDAAMMLGTAGFTAAQCVRELQRNEITPDDGPILVTGATGGVGCLAVTILSRLGYQVTASTGKPDAHDWLRAIGADNILAREAVVNDSQRPMAKALYRGAVDTVGGDTLASVIRAMDVNGCVTACGVVGGDKLPLTVYPFILRGVRLAGITSALCPMPERQRIWENLAGAWRPNLLDSSDEVVTRVELEQLSAYVDKIKAGQIKGRVLVSIN